MQKVIFMVGPYRSGKTEYIQKQFESGEWKSEDFAVLSINNFVERHAKEFKLSHDEAYKSLMATGYVEINPLVKMTYAKMLEILEAGKSVIINNPNINRDVRKVYLDLIPNGVEKEAYNFPVRNFRPWLNRIKTINESIEGYKKISLRKAFQCYKRMEIADISEGFDYTCLVEQANE